MIRKILISIFLIYTLGWFAIAHIIKGNMVNILNNFETDNCKISYNQIKVAGFPSHVQVRVWQPKSKCIYPAYSEEIITDKVTLAFDWSFKKATLLLGNTIKKIKNFDGKTSETSVRSHDDITALVKFNRPAYQSLNSTDLSVIKFFRLDNPLLFIDLGNQEILNIANLTFLISNINSNDPEVICQTSLSYSSTHNFFILKKGEVDFAIASKMTDKENKKISSLHIDHFRFSSDAIGDTTANDTSEDSRVQINLAGGLQSLDSASPTGKLSLELTNYQYIVNKLKLILPPTITQKMEDIIEKSATLEQTAETESNQLPPKTIKLDIEFSDKGIYIGGINLLAFKRQEEREDDLIEENNNVPEEIQGIDKAKEIEQID